MRWKRRLAILTCSSMLWLSSVLPLKAEADDQTKLLLQKGLTIYEIDQELGRLTEQENKLGVQINATQNEISKQDEKVAETRVHAGKVLRSYYMGERDNLWMLIFAAKNFSDALTVFEYLTMILSNDHRNLDKYVQAKQQLKSLQDKQQKEQTTLKQTKDAYLALRTRVLALQKELDAQLAVSTQGKQIADQITQLTKDWQTKGVPAFRLYFSALSEAMGKITEMLSGGSKTTTLSISGLNYVFEMSDQDLNEFLRKKNPLFQNLTFQFRDGYIKADGKHENLDLSIKGHYELAEAEGKTILKFRVDQLVFNGFTLPETTNAALEQEVKMGIEPQKFLSFLVPTGVKAEDGKMKIMMKFSR